MVSPVKLARQRQAAMLDLIRDRGAVRVGELVREFGVSGITVRRDLTALSGRGLVAKVHGGATVPDYEPGFAAKSTRSQAEKEAICAHAATLIRPGAAVALSAGTTTAVLARHLAGVADLTVVTNSLPVAELLHQGSRRGQTVILTGGTRTPSDALVGPIAVAALEHLHVDLLFLGVHGMSERTGFTTPNLLEADTDRALIRSARRLVVLADHTKWDMIGISTIADLTDADLLITDTALPDRARRILQSRVGELRLV